MLGFPGLTTKEQLFLHSKNFDKGSRGQKWTSEEAARDLGATDVKTFWEIVFPLITPSVVGVALLGFTLSYDEFTRSALISGENNTLPLEIYGMTTNVTSPALYALGTLTTVFSFVVIAVAVVAIQFFSRRQQE